VTWIGEKRNQVTQILLTGSQRPDGAVLLLASAYKEEVAEPAKYDTIFTGVSV